MEQISRGTDPLYSKSPLSGKETAMSGQLQREELCRVIEGCSKVFADSPRADLVDETLQNREAILLNCGAIATWAAAHSTGRSPKDTFIVDNAGDAVDWTSPNNNSLSVRAFDELWDYALELLETKDKIYLTNRLIGADPRYSLPTRVVTSRALPALFTYNMFRPVSHESGPSIFAGEEFTLIALPDDAIDPHRFRGKARSVNGETSRIMIATDMKRKLGVVIGSAYCGTIKKMLFTVMNYLLPEHGILPLHCSANHGSSGDVALFLGLSGTGKTTLSSDPTRSLLGDDEHGWSDHGIANFENGCYAKLIHLDPKKEPEIYRASFRHAEPHEHGAIIENAMVYPDGSWDINDTRLTENSRVSYPLSSLENILPASRAGHPRSIIFLTADACGVLPPVARLTPEQAMLWFLIGYTSKLAGTETGVTAPVTTFSRFFGGPFMPRNPTDYTRLFGEKIKRHRASVYLVNTGWTGGPYGEGKRIEIEVTRKIICAAIAGKLENVEYRDDHRFHVRVPISCPNVDSTLLNPKHTWSDGARYEAQASKLAGEFSEHFDKVYGKNNIDAVVRAQCPGK